MNAYVDASVVLRIVLRQRDRLSEWTEIAAPIVSSLVQVECLRSLDRARVREAFTPDEAAAVHEALFRLLSEAHEIDVTRPILARAARPLPTPLGTLDAIHLATALFWRETRDADLLLATHDGALALAARSFGFRVLGVPPAEFSGPEATVLREPESRWRGIGRARDKVGSRRPRGSSRAAARRAEKLAGRAGIQSA